MSIMTLSQKVATPATAGVPGFFYPSIFLNTGFHGGDVVDKFLTFCESVKAFILGHGFPVALKMFSLSVGMPLARDRSCVSVMAFSRGSIFATSSGKTRKPLFRYRPEPSGISISRMAILRDFPCRSVASVHVTPPPRALYLTKLSAPILGSVYRRTFPSTISERPL